MSTGRGVAAVLLILAAPPLLAAPVKIFRAQSSAAFLGGTLEGISVDPLGTLQLTDRVERLAALQEPFLLAAARHPEGWVVGTGNAGRVLLIDRQGAARELHAAPEPEIFAVWVDADGTVFAGSSPQGKVYRIAGGRAEVFFDPQETYIWALARAADGALLVATGSQGRLYRVDAAGEGRVLYDADDTHLRSMAVLAGGEVVLGTAEEGLILELDRDGSARTLYDAAQPEIVGFASAPDGALYVAALASEASLADPGARAAVTQALKQAAGPETPAETAGESVTVTAEGEAEPPASGTGAARRPRPKGPRSEIYRLSAGGVVESLWTFPEETVYTLLWHRGRLWAGTGLEGKLFSFHDGQLVLEKDVDERQVVALVADEPGPSFATTNAAALYRMTGGAERRGTYTSQVLDAGQVATFGTFRWRGELPHGTRGAARLEFSFRSGMSAEPDRTWSPWTAPRSGVEVGLGEVPVGRFLQWRAEFQAGDDVSPRLTAVEISHRHRNQRPRIESLAVLDPGEILVPGNFNPANQVFEPAHPNRQGIFTTLAPAEPSEDGRLKQLWKKGYRTLRWQATDPNEDTLVYRLSFRRDAGGDWLAVAEELQQAHYSFDETVLPDGVYRFRLVASDRPENPAPEALEVERLSEAVVVDGSPPQLGEVRRDGGELRVVVSDAWSPLREAVFSVDGAEWRPALAADGLLDGRAETLRVAPEKPGRFLLLRLTDAAFNVVTYDLSAEWR
jgi:hypothetical protein